MYFFTHLNKEFTKKVLPAHFTDEDTSGGPGPSLPKVIHIARSETMPRVRCACPLGTEGGAPDNCVSCEPGTGWGGAQDQGPAAPQSRAASSPLFQPPFPSVFPLPLHHHTQATPALWRELEPLPRAVLSMTDKDPGAQMFQEVVILTDPTQQTEGISNGRSASIINAREGAGSFPAVLKITPALPALKAAPSRSGAPLVSLLGPI